MKECLAVFKALADESRLKIVRALMEKDMYVEILSERVGLTPATVSFHLKKLQAAGLLEQRREQYYMIYSIRKNILDLTLSALLADEGQSGSQEEVREIQYRQKVIKSFMPYGVCKVLPAQIKKRMIVYEEIMKKFEAGRTYDEKEINETIASVHEDYCSVRRAFIGLGWMSRNGRIYTVHDFKNVKSENDTDTL